MTSNNLPDFVRKIRPPAEIGPLAADLQPTRASKPELYGDVVALNLVDLDREGLAEYKKQVAASLDTSVSSRHKSVDLTSRDTSGTPAEDKRKDSARLFKVTLVRQRSVDDSDQNAFETTKRMSVEDEHYDELKSFYSKDSQNSEDSERVNTLNKSSQSNDMLPNSLNNTSVWSFSA